jgi:hypothetical protein
MSNEGSSSKLNNSQWIVENSKQIATNVSELVMAWARDIYTGEAVYIGELGKDRRGASCNCECISCKAKLVAVNVAKNDFIVRPHFRHPAGTERDNCSVLTARAAALKMFTELGLIELPSYRKSGSFTGFSGKTYNAWVNIPSEKVTVRAFHLRDGVTAELTLEDGRKIRVVLVGEFDAITSNSNSENETRNPITSIRLCVDSPDVAGMDPAELRKKLVILLQQGQWCDYWNEAQISIQAKDLAATEANNLMDWSSEDELQDLLPSTASELLKRETLLHLKAKQILAKAKFLKVPGVVIEASAELPNNEVLERQQTLNACDIQIESAELEKAQGNVRPDVLINTLPNDWWSGGQLMVEVTVTNHIDSERLLRIRKKRIPALEIDLSKLGGFVTEEQFTRILLIELQSKRWLSRSFTNDAQVALERRIEDEAESRWDSYRELKLENEARERTLKQPLSELISEYLQSIEAFADVREKTEKQRSAHILAQASTKLKDSIFQPVQEYYQYEEWMQFRAKTLVWRNFQSAGSSDLIGRKGCIIERLLSIRKNRPIGYQLDTIWQVINSIQVEGDRAACWHTLFLIAIRVYQPTLSKEHKERLRFWRSTVNDSLLNGESKYRRSQIYDSFLAVLFPEMADLLRQPLPNKINSDFHRFVVSGGAKKRNALSADEAAYWLEGKEYEDWARRNPERAKEWENGMKSS